MATLETQLMKAVQEEDLDEVRALIEKGANINIFMSGRSPLSIAAYLGNIPMLELLLNSGRFSPKESPGKEKPTRKNKKDSPSIESPNLKLNRNKRKRHLESKTKAGNNGFYVFIHEENETDDGPKSDINKNTPSIEEVTTPEGMEKLEWDMEVQGETHSENEEEDLWSNQYRWYAKILANSQCSSVEPPIGCDVNLQDSIGRCAIHYAAEYGHVNSVKVLINAGAKVDIGDVESLTPLHLAANKGHLPVVEALLTSGAVVNCKTTDKLSPLHYASSRGYCDIVKLLLEHDANIDSLDSTDRTPLKLATSRNLYDVVKILVENDARVNLEDIKGVTPLCEAVWQKSVDMARLLLNAGAKLLPTPHLLHYAILHQHAEMVELLLEFGALVNVRDNQGSTPLITASVTGQPSVVKLLIKHGAAVDCVGSVTDRPPLLSAIQYKGRTNLEVIRILVEAGADIDRECWNNTPLISALISRKFAVASLLIGLGADVTKSVEHIYRSRDPMQIAIQTRNLPIIRQLFLAGYDITTTPNSASPAPLPEARTITSLLRHLSTNPMNLADLARLRIRQLRPPTMPMMTYLNSFYLPRCIVNFLLMEDHRIRDDPLSPSTPPHLFFGIF